MSRLTYGQVGITEPEEGIIEFEIRPEHLKLLRALQLQWVGENEGYIRTHPDRPHGSTDVLAKAREILENPDLEYSDFERLHLHSLMALQIALKTGKFKAGRFYATKYGQDWRERGKTSPKKDVKTNDNVAEKQIPFDTGGDDA